MPEGYTYLGPSYFPSGRIEGNGGLAMNALANLLGVVDTPGQVYSMGVVTPTIQMELTIADHDDQSAAENITSTGIANLLTVPANQLWRVKLVAAERISGTWTLNKIVWTAPNGNQPIIVLDQTGGRVALVSSGLDFWAAPGSIFGVGIDAFTGVGACGIDVICSIYRVGPLPDLTT